ncbi:RNA methyltransferase [Laccaria bicolor S238N-H82]|uniref:rRNA methyltransferase 2, mitochondrial n=1 Tax=Laccaria bicolor (strain S238N-H82 / ATCC MYA-4686) TaxID=486041 RepID=B0D5C9_LACBS|nr:RNA methyltransferase [Laccaria bicolor S238N-H82]EDR09996.1 predicted protein [Laccaria bicolor S238N-H82]|eukprot:XP_001879381.1 RNA methyltransferase [Laccaria bicolor S238N-H82]
MSFRPSATNLSSLRSSSKSWIARQARDPYVKKRLSDPASYRSRSAFKLLEINDQWDSFLTKPDVKAVVDLGAAPGGWSQVPYDPLNIDDLEPSSALTGRGTIVAVDLLKMQPIHGVHAIQADFLAAETERRIHNLLSVKGNLECKADIILSDIAANASGNDVHDIESSLEICEAVFCFARQYLRSAERIGRRRGGVLLMKHFEHPLLQKFRVEKLLPNFHDVRYIKPDSSRSASREGYFLCQGWKALEE